MVILTRHMSSLYAGRTSFPPPPPSPPPLTLENSAAAVSLDITRHHRFGLRFEIGGFNYGMRMVIRHESGEVQRVVDCRDQWGKNPWTGGDYAHCDGARYFHMLIDRRTLAVKMSSAPHMWIHSNGWSSWMWDLVSVIDSASEGDIFVAILRGVRGWCEDEKSPFGEDFYLARGARTATPKTLFDAPLFRPPSSSRAPRSRIPVLIVDWAVDGASLIAQVRTWHGGAHKG